MTEPRGLIQFQPSRDGATDIEVDCQVRAERPVSRRLFGKFAEHLGRNIYNGMWAQILQNPTFGDWSFFRPVWKQADRWRKDGIPIDRVLAACERGLACWWMPYGSAEAAYSLDWVDPLSVDTSQRVGIPSAATESGVEQVVYLPAHRTRGFTAGFFARGSVAAVRVSLVREGSDEALAEGVVRGIETSWKRFEAGLGVRVWEIGNEIYGRWQIGHCTPEEYAERYDAFQKAMLAADPDLLLIANGQSLEWVPEPLAGTWTGLVHVREECTADALDL